MWFDKPEILIPRKYRSYNQNNIEDKEKKISYRTHDFYSNMIQIIHEVSYSKGKMEMTESLEVKLKKIAKHYHEIHGMFYQSRDEQELAELADVVSNATFERDPLDCSIGLNAFKQDKH